jgi:hypothetical protein
VGPPGAETEPGSRAPGLGAIALSPPLGRIELPPPLDAIGLSPSPGSNEPALVPMDPVQLATASDQKTIRANGVQLRNIEPRWQIDLM